MLLCLKCALSRNDESELSSRQALMALQIMQSIGIQYLNSGVRVLAFF